jgi:hypothetical protein
MSDAPDIVVSFIIVNYRVAAKVRTAVDSICEHCNVAYEVIVVDNSEQPEELARLQTLLSGLALVVDAKSNRGFGAGCNLGARAARGRYLFLLNPDARLTSAIVRPLIDHLESDPSLGSIGTKLLYEDGAEGHSSGAFIGLRRPVQMIKGSLVGFVDSVRGRTSDKSPKRRLTTGLQKVDWCSGAGLMIRKADFARVDGFDESYFLYYEECDLQYRMLRDLRLRAAVDGDVTIVHEDGGTGLEHPRKRKLIESGCLHFVHDHRSPPVYWLYRLLMIHAIGVEAALAALLFEFEQLSIKIGLLEHVLLWRAQNPQHQ